MPKSTDVKIPKVASKQKNSSWLDRQIRIALRNLEERPIERRSPFHAIEKDENDLIRIKA